MEGEAVFVCPSRMNYFLLAEILCSYGRFPTKEMENPSQQQIFANYWHWNNKHGLARTWNTLGSLFSFCPIKVILDGEYTHIKTQRTKSVCSLLWFRSSKQAKFRKFLICVCLQNTGHFHRYTCNTLLQSVTIPMSNVLQRNVYKK